MSEGLSEQKKRTDDNTENTLRRLLAQRILLFDGAMGTMIQRLKFDEQDFRGKKYANHNRPLKGATIC
jgi:5-methyltetrahydrofolate--homocysteine methyltransferase